MDFRDDELRQPVAQARVRHYGRWLLALLLLAGAGYALLRYALLPPPQARARVIILGFDGLEATLVERWAAEGKLPAFKQFIDAGQFHRLQTTTPAQSPVSWSSFISGSNPGKHSIFDFLARDARTYMPDLSLVRQDEDRPGEFISARRGFTFWQALEEARIPTRIIHCPVTFPPEGSSHILAGMGVPDIRGTQGTFSFYTEEQDAGGATGGSVMTVAFTGSDAPGRIIGPQVVGSNTPAETPFTIRRSGAAVTLLLNGRELPLAEGKWSDWQRFTCPLGMGQTVSAIGRFHLVSAQPLRLYLSPLQFDPTAPYQPISVPGDLSAELAEEIGLYHTLGMPEETWGLNERRLSEEAFLAQCTTLLDEQEAMLARELRDCDAGVLLWVTMVSDRMQHMYWRTIDERHPLYAPQLAARYGNVLSDMYARCDRTIAKVRAKLRPEDTLIVMSDHGFSSFRRAAHVNSFLRARGYLVLRDGADTSAEFFAQVDWSRTRAYALGLGGVYLNRAGREGQGIITEAAVPALKRELAAAFTAWRDGREPVVRAVADCAEIYSGPYAADGPDLFLGFAAGYRASWQTALGAVPAVTVEDNLKQWSGDHLVDPALVPGVLCVTRPLNRDGAHIMDIAPTLLRHYGLTMPVEIDGTPLW